MGTDRKGVWWEGEIEWEIESRSGVGGGEGGDRQEE